MGTITASYLARTKGSDEPQKSRLRARELGQFLREMELFSMDHGHEYGDKWDNQINGFRLSLERILGNHPRSYTNDPDEDADSNAHRGKGARSDDHHTVSSTENG